MAGVFFGFGVADTVVIRTIGIGMGIAVLIDLSIVRVLLVPATIRAPGTPKLVGASVFCLPLRADRPVLPGDSLFPFP